MNPTPFVPFSALLTDSALVFSDFTTGEGISFGRFFGGRPRFRLTTGAVSASAGDSLVVDELVDELTEASGTAAAFVDTNLPADDRLFSPDKTFSTDFL